ncbi:MAG: ribose-phosphate pyrophosphokinase-like domain-containing protein, partial [Rickettsiaceae bacterium]|nr:ribose-phosphate pyrophosphokinase-like domain-containing protein [Rickettsiaceae bacterium]
MKNNMKIIAGSSNPNLALRLGVDLGFEVLDTKLSKFNDGELKIQVHGLIGKEILLM